MEPVSKLEASAPTRDLSRERVPTRPKRAVRSLFESPLLIYGSVCIIGLTVLLGLAWKNGLDEPFGAGTDASQYVGIAASMAHGGGYRNPAGLWPEQPALDRMPVWPVILSLGMRVFPNALDERVARLTSIISLALAGVAFAVLCRRLGARPGLSLVGGLCVSLSPVTAYLGLGGLSEIPFILIVGTGLALAFSGPRYLHLSALLIGLGALARPNFVLVPLLFAGFIFLLPSTRRRFLCGGSLRRAALALLLTLLPTALWLARNYELTGRFPLLTSVYGETLYGSNNERVTNEVGCWGMWIFPDSIPGETPKLLLKRRFHNEVALSDYYAAQSMAWIRTHVPNLPRLVVGKLVRGCVPVPWGDSPTPLDFLAAFARFMVQCLFLVTAPFWWRGMSRPYLLFLAALGITNLITTVVFYGSVRQNFCFFEVFTVPCTVLGIGAWMDARRKRKPERLVMQDG